MCNRKTALELIKISGYHNNSDWVRIYCENRISYQVAREMWAQGQKMRNSGIKCTCRDCNN